MTTSTEIETEDIVWSEAIWPEDSHITDAVIEESRKARVELLAAMAETRAARAES